MAAPGRFPGFPDLPGENFIQTDWGAPFASHPDWRSWAAANGLPAPEPGHGLRVSHTAAAIAAARWGLGVALVPARLVAAEIGAGQLVALAGESVPLAWDYVAVTLSASGGRRAIRALLDLLRT